MYQFVCKVGIIPVCARRDEDGGGYRWLRVIDIETRYEKGAAHRGSANKTNSLFASSTILSGGCWYQVLYVHGAFLKSPVERVPLLD